jgi:sortase (surface protein transpeptidase)
MTNTPARVRRSRRGRRVLTAAVVLLGVLCIAVAAYGLGARQRDASTAVGPHLSAPVITSSVASVAHPRDARAPSTTTTALPARPMRPTPKPEAKPKPRAKPVRPANFAPVAVSVPSVGINAPLVRLGLNPDHTLEVPRDFNVAGWYVYRSIPGDRGPSVIAGHVDSKRGPAVFYRLKDVKPGAAVSVRRSDGSVATFRVTALEEHSKNAFPTARVYGPTPGRVLRLITCGGAFNRSTGHYEDNIIVFATLTKIA